MLEDEKINKYPAEFIAHWINQNVPCCENHRNQIVKLGAFVGLNVLVTENNDKDLECKNCINENL